MHAHRIDILDRADDDGVVGTIAHDLHLIFLPAEDRFLDEHLGGGTGFEPTAHDRLEFVAVIGDAPARPTEREARADDRGQPDMVEPRQCLLQAVRDRRARAFEPDPVHRLAELESILSLFDRLGIGADQLNAQPVECAVLEQRQRGVERGLPAHGRKESVGPLLLDDLGNDSGRDRLDVRRIGKLGVGHDRRRVRIDDDDPIALSFQRLDRLASGVIELRRLADDDRAGADDQDR